MYKYFHFRIIQIFLLCIISQTTVLAQAGTDRIVGYGKASYNSTQQGSFMKTWLVTGPFSVRPDTIHPDETAQENIFKTDIINKVDLVAGKAASPVTNGQETFNWRLIASGDDIVSLDNVFLKKDFAYSYAVAEIKASAPGNVMLAVGSDDGIKIWLNGTLVHTNWIGRGASKDNDLVPLKLIKGSNQLLLKVQDMEGGWSFVARLLDKAALTDQLINAVGQGSMDKVRMLIDGGADINAANAGGISPVVAAKINGRDEMIKMLLAKGATDKAVPAADKIVDNYYVSLAGKSTPGIAVLVAKEGKILYRKGFGFEDTKNKILVSPDTKFRIGSVTKQFTAAAILKLQEKGLLSVDDKLSKFIPDFPRGDEVTIHQLLTHISGIHSYTSNDGFTDRVTKTVNPDTLINAIKKDPYDFNPGERMLYNNSGYFILGYIIGKVSGKPYAEYLKETFFDPLKMTNTGVHYAGIKLDHEAKGYGKNGSGNYEDALNWDMSWAGGAGAIYSTVDDLLKWNEALYGGKILSEKSLQQALTPAVLKNEAPAPMKYGYGLGLNKYRGEEIISHSGGLHGFITQLAYYPQEKLTVVMFSNTDEPNVNFDPTKIAEAFLWNKMEKQVSFVETKEKPKDLKIFTGRFELTNVGLMTITSQEDQLFAQLSGQAKYEIFPLSANEFFWKIVEAKVKFIKDEKGDFTEAIVYQNGQEIKGKKLTEEIIITLDPAILDNYTGKYRLNENIVVIVTRENNKLFGEPTGQPKVEMQAVSETDFVIKEINAKLSFVKDEKRKVIKIKLNMNGMDSELPKIE